MKRRIKQLFEVKANPAAVVKRDFPTLTPELEAQIFEDITERRLLTYAEAADKLGCTAKKMRCDARGYPVIKAGKEHKIPESVFRLIVRESIAPGVAPERV